MSLRVTQSQMYGAFTNNMNSSLLNLVESNLQASTQLKINRPSDDPAASGMIISTKASLSRLTVYQANIGNAQGWLGVSDSILASSGSVMTVLTKIQTLAQQGATGTYTKENRLQIGEEVYQHFKQLMNLANSTYAGKHVFAGHKTDVTPYQETLGVTCRDDNLWLGGGWPADTEVSGSFKDTFTINNAALSGTTPEYLTFDYTGSDNIPHTAQAKVDDKGNVVLNLPGGSITAKASDLNGAGPLTVTEPRVTGALNSTIIIQPVDLGTKAAQDVNEYRYSSDGGLTWSTVSGPFTDTDGDGLITIDVGGTSLTIAADAQVTGVPEGKEQEEAGETWIKIRPAAQYMGDDHDTQVSIGYGVKGITPDVSGYFSRDIAVRIDNVNTDDPNNPVITYSYSMNDGSSWTEAELTYNATTSPTSVNLPVPGGYLTLNTKTSVPPAADDGTNIAADLKVGNQFIIHPHRADINIAISDHDAITVNLIGKDVFGGQYKDPETGQVYTVGNGSTDNLFDVVGELVGHCMTGDQQGIQECLAKLQDVMQKITTNAAIVGGRWNRLEVTATSIDNRQYDETAFLSNLQDVDVSELMIRQAQQQVAYNSVLKSTSMIMQMSLVNFL